MSKKISEIMSKNIIAVNVHNDLYDAATLMQEYDFGFLPVLDDKRVVGVVTDRDLVLEGYAKKKPYTTTISDVMTRDFVYINKDTSVIEASEVMAKQKLRRLCVVDEGELVGICTIGDLAVHDIYQNEAGEALASISTPNKDLYVN